VHAHLQEPSVPAARVRVKALAVHPAGRATPDEGKIEFDLAFEARSIMEAPASRGEESDDHPIS
jgi:hypothetical protein